MHGLHGALSRQVSCLPGERQVFALTAYAAVRATLMLFAQMRKFLMFSAF
jgi:hypothetical protein